MTTLDLPPTSATRRSSRPRLPGYVIDERLGSGAEGEVWGAVRGHDGLEVAVKVVAGEPSPERAVHRALTHPHVVRLLDEVDLADGRTALVLERAGGGTLGEVVAARGHLTPGEVSTVLVALASTVSELHRLGVTHADLSPGNVLFHCDGRPMVADLGSASVAGVWDARISGTDGFVDPAVLLGGQPGPASDVYALGALGWLGLTGLAPAHPLLRPPLAQLWAGPAALAEQVEAALRADPLERPEADALAAAVYAACPPAAVSLARGPDPAAQLTHRIRSEAQADADPPAVRVQRGRRRRGRRRTVRTVVVATVGAATLLGGWLLRPGPDRVVSVSATTSRSPSATARPAAASSDDPTDQTEGSSETSPSQPWPTVVRALAVGRAQAFATPTRQAAVLSRVDAPGSSAWASDAKALHRLRSAGVHYRGLTISVGSATLVSQRGRRARVRAVVTTSAYDVVDASGQVRSVVPVGRAVVVVMDLRRLAAGWRLAATS